MLEVRLLGQFEVNKDGERIEIPSRPAQSLLAYLILRAGRAHRREKLAGLLWPDSDEKNARANLRHSIWRLRQAIGAEYLPSDKITVSFDSDREYWLDTAVVERAAPPATDDLMGDLMVYGGELLPGFYEDWTVLDRERLRAVFERKIHNLLDRLLTEKRWQEASEWGERWMALGHVPEPACRAMMLAAAGMGDTSGVAAIYRRCEDALRTELGVEPSERTRRVYEELSTGGTPQGLIQEEVPLSAAVGVERMLAGWREQGVEVLDVASLAIVHAAPDGEPFEEADAALLIRSALEHGVDVEPWLDRAPSQLDAIHALLDSYDRYPKQKVRRRIVEALAGLRGEEVTEALNLIVAKEDNPTVRAEAAVAAATNGQVEGVVETLRVDLVTNGSASALAAFVAVADEVGLPQDVASYPRLQVGASLAQRRWVEHKGALGRQTLRAGLGAGIGLAIQGLGVPFFTALAFPAEYRETLELVSLPGWILGGAIIGLFIGFLQGALAGFLVGLGDALWRERVRARWIIGGVSGLFHSAYLIVFTVAGLFDPPSSATIYIPLNFIYGILVGLALTYVIPPLGSASDMRRQSTLSIRSALALAVATIPYVLIVYQQYASVTYLSRIFYAVLLSLGMGLALANRGSSSDIAR
ncbi:MAG: BTAD domain-containing putative transcriptional regulator [Anaerolineales bacterium]